MHPCPLNQHIYCLEFCKSTCRKFKSSMLQQGVECLPVLSIDLVETNYSSKKSIEVELGTIPSTSCKLHPPTIYERKAKGSKSAVEAPPLPITGIASTPPGVYTGSASDYQSHREFIRSLIRQDDIVDILENTRPAFDPWSVASLCETIFLNKTDEP
jgi:hypothetical protein